MLIQFLWWAGCPSHPEAWQLLQHILAEMAVEATVTRVEIQTEAEAETWHFPGSPTILVNGKDIAPVEQAAYRLTCRLYYREDGRPSPLPSEAMIRRALEQARAAGSS
jgi:hypothetical protein